jgi:restriction endonuclease S subunit
MFTFVPDDKSFRRYGPYLLKLLTSGTNSTHLLRSILYYPEHNCVTWSGAMSRARIEMSVPEELLFTP